MKRSTELPALKTNAAQVRASLGLAPDASAADDLKRKFRCARQEQCPLFLNRDELLDIAKWKLGGQYGQVKSLFERNSCNTVLALTFPEDYAVIDFRGWRQAYGEPRTAFSLRHYATYIESCIELAVRLNTFP